MTRTSANFSGNTRNFEAQALLNRSSNLLLEDVAVA